MVLKVGFEVDLFFVLFYVLIYLSALGSFLKHAERLCFFHGKA